MPDEQVRVGLDHREGVTLRAGGLVVRLRMH